MRATQLAQGKFKLPGGIFQISPFLLAPRSVLMLAAFVALLLLFIGTQYLSQQPYFNAHLTVQNEAIQVLDAEGQQYEINGIFVQGKILPLSKQDISDDPDFIRTFEEFESYFSHQSRLYQALLNPSVTFSLASNVDVASITLKQQSPRVKNLPLTFWMLQVYGMLALFTGLAFWAYHRRQAVTRVLALGGVGCYVMQTSQSIYASREIAMHGDHFQWLVHINHFGGMLFVFSLVMLLWFYPKPMKQHKLALLLSVVTAGVWVNELIQWIEWPVSLFYFPAIILTTFTGVLLYKQWLRCRDNTEYRRLYLWLVYSILTGLGVTFTVYIVPILLVGEPLVSTWIANTFCLLVFLGFVLGVNYGGLFSVERWWLKACFNVLIAIVIIVVDLAAIALLGTEAALGFGIIAVLSFWIYLWLRTKLWVFISGSQNKDVALANMLIDHNGAADTAIVKNDQEEPLAINAVQVAYAKPQLDDHGFKIHLTFPVGVGENKNGYKSYEMIGKNNGQRVFTKSDCQFIADYLEHVKSLEHLYKEKEATLMQERDRIMRDLHDEVAADLLGVVHSAKDTDTRQQAQHCLKSLRELVYSMDDTQPRFLLDAMANWRFEISQLIENAEIELEWLDNVISQEVALTGAQWLHLSKVLRELVTNAIKQSSTTSIVLAFNLNQNHFIITVTNDGVSDEESTETWQRGKGLKSIERRIAELFGTVGWQIEDDHCQATVSIPI